VAMSIGLSILNAGNVLLQTPIGWASDRLGRRTVLIACALCAAAGALILPVLITSKFFYVFLFFWGALAYGVVTISLAAIGDKLTGSDLLRANAVMTMAVGAGGLLGPSLAGFLVSTGHINGMCELIAILYFSLVLFALTFNIVRTQR
jgi:MFS family permease